MDSLALCVPAVAKVVRVIVMLVSLTPTAEQIYKDMYSNGMTYLTLMTLHYRVPKLMHWCFVRHVFRAELIDFGHLTIYRRFVYVSVLRGERVFAISARRIPAEEQKSCIFRARRLKYEKKVEGVGE